MTPAAYNDRSCMMKTLKNIRSPLAVALAAALAVPGFALAAGPGGGVGGGMGTGLQTRDRIHSPDQLQTRDQDRLKVHDAATAAAAGDQDRLQTRLRDMDRTRDQLHQEKNAGKREQLRKQYRQQIQEGMDALQKSTGPGPGASEKQQLQYMEQHMQQMQEMLQHTWNYQNATGAAE
jgi:hypothetical protein